MLEFKVGKKINSVNCHIFNIDTYEKQAPNGNIGAFVKMEAPNWCGAIVKNRSNGKYVCVKEFRHGVNKVVTQFPCGTVEKGETAEVCVKREVCEELGITEEDILVIRKLYSGCPNPAFMDNTMTFFEIVIKDFKPKEQKLDSMEFVEVVELTKEEVDSFLRESDAALMQMFAWKCLFEE